MFNKMNRGETPVIIFFLGMIVMFVAMFFVAIYLADFAEWAQAPPGTKFSDIYKKNHGGEGSTTDINPDFSGEGSKVNTNTLEQGSRSSYKDKGALIVSDFKTFREVWKKAHGSETGIPTIDFSSEMVLAVFQGKKNTGGHSIRISDITNDEGQLNVSVVETVPGSSCVVTQSETQPYHLISIPITGQTINFKSETVVNDC